MSKEHRYYFNELAKSWHNKHSSEELYEYMQQFGIRSDDVVLDVGAGAGALTSLLVKLITAGRVVAADISERMLNAARKNLAANEVFYLCTDACNLAFAKNTFDKIVCYSTFPHICKPQCALHEFYRVLRPGGVILIFHNCCSRKLNHYHAKRPGIVSFDKLPKSEQLQTLMQKAGFSESKTIEQPDLYWVEARKVID